MKVHSLKELANLQVECRYMAEKLQDVRPLRHGNFPMRRITEKVLAGNILLHELTAWYPLAQQLTNEL